MTDAGLTCYSSRFADRILTAGYCSFTAWTTGHRLTGTLLSMVLFFTAQYRPRYSRILVRQRHYSLLPPNACRELYDPLRHPIAALVRGHHRRLAAWISKVRR